MEGFKKARPEVFAFATKPVAPAEEKSPKRRREKSQTVEGDEEPVRKRTRSTRQTRSTQETVIVDTDEEDADFIPGMWFSIRRHSQQKLRLPNYANNLFQKMAMYNVPYARNPSRKPP